MRITIDIDDNLMREAMRLSGLPTKKATVEAALRLLIQTHSQPPPICHPERSRASRSEASAKSKDPYSF
jgi:Bacterial antitoxin of type II TA system, VapB